MKSNIRKWMLAAGLLTGFAVWTLGVCLVDVGEIGPQDTSVGLSSINQWFHGLTGVNLSLYVLTDWLGLLPVGICAGFGTLGLTQWIRRRSIWKVDKSLLILGCIYLLMLVFYLLFEKMPINYRPVLIDGNLEASYPSSTTLLTVGVMATAMMQCGERMRKGLLKKSLLAAMAAFTAFMILGRVWAGVHWISDIAGGLLLGLGLAALYAAWIESLRKESKQDKNGMKKTRLCIQPKNRKTLLTNSRNGIKLYP